MYEFNLGIKFENIVNKYPNNTALQFDKPVYYKQLNTKVNQLSRFLLEKGVKQNDVVCISGIKNLNTYACMLACLKIGAIYSILDYKSPVERLNRIITTCSPRLLFIDRDLQNHLTKSIKKVKTGIITNEPELNLKLSKYKKSDLDITQEINGSNPAYIMFTSGSTGFPKGALMTHNNILNFIAWSIKTYNLTSKDVFTNVNPLYFDNSVFDFYSSIFTGAALVPISRELVMEPNKLVRRIDKFKCTVWFSVPSLLIYLNTMRVLNKNNMKYITRFIFGGEGYPKPKLKELFDLYSHRAEFFNVYGPTECTCICSSYKITDSDFKSLIGLPPLGRIADNFSYLLLDENGKKVKPDQVGELYLLGPNVGKGYYNDKKRTQEKFIQNPHNISYSEVMYKTGDLIKYNSSDNYLYFSGRKDNQIKHMGYRIELEEIEVALSRLKYITQAAVIHGQIKGLSQIIAVVSSKTNLDELRIKNDLKKILPNYMIPNKVYQLKVLPKNANGKIDKRILITKYLIN